MEDMPALGNPLLVKQRHDVLLADSAKGVVEEHVVLGAMCVAHFEPVVGCGV
jgi:hypothetical protein